MKTSPPNPREITEKFNYMHPIFVRYADLDPQQHVNNAAVVTYLESARIGYYQAIGIWDGVSIRQIGMVVASLHVDYLRPIRFGTKVSVGVAVRHIGNKSLRFRLQVIGTDDKTIFARSETIMVAYDPQKEQSIQVPQDWREKINAFEAQGEEK